MPACRDCGHDVSRSAKSCPQCGVKNPATSATVYKVAIVIATVCAVAVGLLVWYVMYSALQPIVN